MVFAGLFPSDGEQYSDLRDALEKLKLNDASLHYVPETSQALGFGFRVGFLGLLHMEVIRERLEREFDLELIATTPNVEYRVTTVTGEEVSVNNPSQMPDANAIEAIAEPYVKSSVIVPKEYVGVVMELCQDRRGEFDHMEYLTPTRVALIYKLPLAEIVLDFYDQLKSRTKGYASFDYEISGWTSSNLVKVDILLNGDVVDALSLIVHRDKAYYAGRALVERLRAIIPRQMFDVPVQAAIGSRVIARETIKAKRKDVLSKCYGGDISRKRKLIEKQKKGKKRMKQLGIVEVPQEAFLAVLSLDEPEVAESGRRGRAARAMLPRRGHRGTPATRRGARRRRRTQHPERLIAYSFAVVIAIGTALLMLPFATARGDERAVRDRRCSPAPRRSA